MTNVETSLSTQLHKTEAVHWHHLVYGLRLCSNQFLLELPRADFMVKDLAFHHIRPEEGGEQLHQGWRLLTRRTTSLGYDLAMYDTGPEYLLRWEGQCDFLVAKDGRQVQCQPLDGTDFIWVRSTLYSFVLSFVLHLRGMSNFHASAIQLPGGAVGFMANPGSGKSTLATAFSMEGYPFLTDDVLAVQEEGQGYLTYPGFPFVSLSSRSIDSVINQVDNPAPKPLDDEKSRVTIDGSGMYFRAEPVPLQSLFVLARDAAGSAIKVERLPRTEAIKGLLEHTNCLPLLPAPVLQHHLAFLTRMLDSIPVYRLCYPSDFKRMPRVIGAVLAQRREAVPSRKAD